MANLHDLKRRITSVQKTKKITQALNMVSAAKFRKAQGAVLNARPYEKNLKLMIRDVFERTPQEIEHEYFKERTKGKTLLVVIAADSGLCGGFNASIIKKTNRYLAENSNQEIDLFLIGSKAVKYYLRHNSEFVKYHYENVFDKFEYHDAVHYADQLVDLYLQNDFKEIVIIYNEFKSAITQNVIDEKYLPVLMDEIIGSEKDYKKDKCTDENEGKECLSNYIYEPSQQSVLDKIIKHFLHYKIYRTLVESYASEQGARMTAMDSATENAIEVIDMLALKYNRERQAKITAEIAEIIGGSMS